MTQYLPTSTIFRRYDIRGIVGTTLTEKAVRQIGLAYAGLLHDKRETQAIIARDARLSSPLFSHIFIEALLDSGIHVTDIGAVPTPVAYFAGTQLNIGNVIIITGSHNPADYNGIKLLVQGMPLHSERLQGLYFRIRQEDFRTGQGRLKFKNILPAYWQRIIHDIQLDRPLKIAADCGNGIAGISAAPLLKQLGCEVTGLFCEPDGNFPNHHPDPASPKNLQDLKAVVLEGGYDIGLAFDGDGDRVGVLDAKGNIIWPDRQMMLLSQDILSRQPGATIIYDVKSSHHLGRKIAEWGGKPMMWASGYTLIRQKLVNTNAALGGELSGHIFFNDRWLGFDDGLYTAVRLLELIARSPKPSDQVFAAFPEVQSTPELAVKFNSEWELRQFMQQFLNSEPDFNGADICRIDGFRVDYPDRWGLVRVSHTSPVLSLRFEGDNNNALEQIQNQFRSALLAVKPDLNLPF